MDTAVPLELSDLSMGGFSVRSAEVLPVGEVMRFRFRTPSGSWAAAITAKSVYSDPIPQASGASSAFLSGFKFLNPESPSVQARIHSLVDHATSVVTFS